MIDKKRISYVPTVIRQGVEGDVSFIYSSWLRSYRDHSSHADLIPKEIYYKCQARIIRKLLDSCGIAVACNPEDQEQIFGYCIYSPSSAGIAIVHYLYVKHPYRKLGIATTLRDWVKYECGHDNGLPVVATHETANWNSFSSKWNMIYNPYLIGASAYD